MARVVVAPSALEDLDSMIDVLRLPDDTRSRVAARLQPLERFPKAGPRLPGRWRGFRFILGPWRWMLIVYAFDESADEVQITTIQDARSATSATSHP